MMVIGVDPRVLSFSASLGCVWRGACLVVGHATVSRNEWRWEDVSCALGPRDEGWAHGCLE